MKKQLKSLAAIALACFVAFGFSSCKKDEPKQITYGFQNSIAFNSEIVDMLNITFELTDIEGKTTTTNINDCPTKEVTYAGKTRKMYVFNKLETTINKPTESKLSIKFEPNGRIPASGSVDLYVIQDFYVGGYDNGNWDTGASKETGIVFWGERSVADAEEASMLATSLNMAFGKFTLKIGESGGSSISKK